MSERSTEELKRAFRPTFHISYDGWGGAENQPFLTIDTVVINDDLLDMINVDMHNWAPPQHDINIIFNAKRIPDIKPNKNIRFCPTMYKWERFAAQVNRIIIDGILDGGFTVDHLFCCKQLKSLCIGATTNTLFEGMDTAPLYYMSKLNYIRFNGYGLVNYGQNVKDWLEYMEKNYNTKYDAIY